MHLEDPIRGRLTFLVINGLIVGVSSAASLVVEIVAGRMLAPYVGMSLYSWTAVIATVLAGLSLGNFIGGFAFTTQDTKHNSRFMALMLTIAALSTAAAPWLLQKIAPALTSDTRPILSMLTLCLLVFMPPSLCLGAVSPVATAMAQEQSPDKGKILGFFFALGAIGSILGTLLSGFLFLAYLGSHATLAIIACVNMVLGGICLCMAVQKTQRFVVIALASIMAIIFSLWPLYGVANPCQRESAYYCIRVEQYSDNVRIMVLDHLVHGFNHQTNPQYFNAPYVGLMDYLARTKIKEEKRAFFIGGGAFTLPRAWSARAPNMEMIIAEIDPVVTEIAQQELWYRPTPLTEIHHGDARSVLRQNKKPFDVIVGDAFHDLSVPQHLTTYEFGQLVRKNLQTDGLYLLNVIDHVQQPKLMLSVWQTLRQQFQNVAIFMKEDDLKSWDRTTFVVAASETFTPQNGYVVSGNRFIRLPHGYLEAKSEVFVPLTLTDDYSPVDRLLFF